MSIIRKLFLYINLILFISLLAGCSSMLDVPGKGVAGLTIAAPGGGYSVAEHNGVLTLTAVLDREPIADVTVSLSTSDNTEAVVSTPSLTFTPSNWSTPQTFSVNGVDEFIADGNKNIFLRFSAATTTDPAYIGYVKPEIGIIVIDNETPSIVVSATTLTTAELTTDPLYSNTATFTVVLSSQPVADVTVTLNEKFDAVNNAKQEGKVSSNLLNFTTSNWSTPQMVTVTGVDDATLDWNKVYTIHFVSTSTDPIYNNMAINSVTVTNIDDQLPRVDVATGVHASATPNTLDLAEGGTAGTFTVVLAVKPTGDVIIPISIGGANPGRVTFTTPDSAYLTSLKFTTSNWNVTQTVTVTPVAHDSISGGPTTATIILGAAGAIYNNCDPQDISVTISDPDTVGLVVSSLSAPTDEGGSTSYFTVRLSSKPTANVTVTLDEHLPTIIGGIPVNVNQSYQEGTVDTQIPGNPRTLVFTDTNWNSNQYVYVTGVKDDIVDSDKTYNVQLKSSSAGDSKYNLLAASQLAATNNNINGLILCVKDLVNGGGTTKVTSSSVTFSGFATDEKGQLGYNYARFSVCLGSKPDTTVTLTFNSAGSPCTLNTSTLSFDEANWNTFQEVQVTGVSDSASIGGRLYTITTTLTGSDTNYTDPSKVKPPSFSIFSCDNDMSNKIAYCRKSGSFSTSESNGTATFWMLGQSAPAQDVTVPVSVTDTFSYPPATVISKVKAGFSSSYTGSSNATITSANWNTLDPAGKNKVTLQGQDDGVNPKGGQLYNVSIGTSTSSDLVFHNINPADFALYNGDNDQVIEIITKTNTTKDDVVNGTSGSFGVRLKTPPSDTVTFTIALAISTDQAVTLEGGTSPVTLTFTTSDWSDENLHLLTIVGKDNDKVEGNKPSSVTFGPISSNDLSLDGYQSGNLTAVTNVDTHKLIWITQPLYQGNMSAFVNAAGGADSHCNSSDSNFPALFSTNAVASYKALIVDDGSHRRAPIGAGTPDDTGVDWVLKKNTTYYLKTAGNAASYTTQLFKTDQYGIPGAFMISTGFDADTSVTYWTGFNPDSTWTSSTNNCGLWKVDSMQGTYGVGGTKTPNAYSFSTATSTGVFKSIIAVQQ